MFKYLRRLNFLIYPEGFFAFSSKIMPFLGAITVVLLTIGLYGALFSSPADYQQGEGVRIIYVHVPCAMLSMGIFTFMAFSSVCYLIWRIKLYDLFAECAAPLGAAFTFLALITGSLWGKPMWGTWWIWDARLTSELILLFIYIAYILLRKSLPNQKSASKACALLAIIGFIDIPIIHYSVKWWHTLHQGSTLTLFGKPTIVFEMLWPLLTMIVGLGMLFALIWLLLVRAEILTQYKHQLWLKPSKESV